MPATTQSHNPLSVGQGSGPRPQPCSLVIFGGGGDLARRKLIPGLYNLALDGVLPAHFAVFGFGRTDVALDAYRASSRKNVETYSRRPVQEPQWSDFEKKIHWVTGNLSDPASYALLKSRLLEVEAQLGIPGNRVFYLSIPPSQFEPCVENLRASGLVTDPADTRNFTR